MRQSIQRSQYQKSEKRDMENKMERKTNAGAIRQGHDGQGVDWEKIWQ